MPTEKSNDVNTKTGSSPTTTQQTAETKTAATVADVKTTASEKNTESLIDAIIEGASDSEGIVLNKNKTAEEEKVEETEKKDEEVVEAEEKDEEADDQKSDETTETEAEIKTTEESVPYERFKEVNDKVVSYEPLAKEHQQLLQYCNTNNITVEQFQDGLELMRLENADPAAALKRLTEKVEGIKVASGQGLPADLAQELSEAKKEVEEGTMSAARYTTLERRAKEIAELRLKHTGLEKQNRFSALQQQQQQNTAVFQSLATWSEGVRKLDPDFQPKKTSNAPDGMFEDFLAHLMYVNTTKPPQSVEDHLNNAKAAYSKVKDSVKRYSPKPAAKKVLTSNGSTTKSTSTGEPKTADDVVNLVAKKHGY